MYNPSIQSYEVSDSGIFYKVDWLSVICSDCTLNDAFEFVFGSNDFDSDLWKLAIDKHYYRSLTGFGNSCIFQLPFFS